MSYLYFIQVGEDGPIKIGIATNPEDRCASLQGGNPYKLHIRAIEEGGRAMERALHRRFADWRLEGEWFEAAAPGLQERINAAVPGTKALLEEVRDDVPPEIFVSPEE